MPAPARSLVAVAVALLLVAPVAAEDAAVAPPPTVTSTAGPAGGSVRPRPDARHYDNPFAQPDGTEAAGDVRGAALPAETPPAEAVARPDDPVLRWLPEIQAAADATGTPRSLIAGVMRLESGGDPESVSVAGAQGLMQVMPVELAEQGIGSADWRDPATNVLAGARILAQRSGAGWEMATAYYFGIGCDAYGTCTGQYVVVAVGWANYYAAVLGDPVWYDASVAGGLPTAPSPTPTPTPTPSPTPTSTAVPPTPAPTEPSIEPTAVPTDVPTPEPTLEPTEPPAPTAAPTDAPAEPTDAPVPTDVPPVEAATETPAA